MASFLKKYTAAGDRDTGDDSYDVESRQKVNKVRKYFRGITAGPRVVDDLKNSFIHLPHHLGRASPSQNLLNDIV